MTLAPFLCCQRCIVAQIDPINGRHGLNMAGRKLLDKDYIASTARYTATITGPGISRIVEISFSAKMVKKKTDRWRASHYRCPADGPPKICNAATKSA